MSPPSRLTAHHVAVKVRSLERAEAFYAGVLGLEVLRRWEDASGLPRSVWLDLGGVILMLERSEAAVNAGPGPADSRPAPRGVDPDAPFSDDPPGWHVLAIRIPADTREAWRAHLEASGVPIVHESAFTLYVRDREGNRLGLSHFPDPAPAG